MKTTLEKAIDQVMIDLHKNKSPASSKLVRNTVNGMAANITNLIHDLMLKCQISYDPVTKLYIFTPTIVDGVEKLPELNPIWVRDLKEINEKVAELNKTLLPYQDLRAVYTSDSVTIHVREGYCPADNYMKYTQIFTVISVICVLVIFYMLYKCYVNGIYICDDRISRNNVPHSMSYGIP